MPTITSRTVSTNGVDLHVTEAGEGFPVVFVHGFPELAHSWRHQLPAIASAGYHAIAPDMRGYGRSTKPAAIEDYDILHLTDDLLGIVDDLGEDRAVFVGHDWGSIVTWQMALLHPDRVAGVCGMSVPFLPRTPLPPIQLMRQALGDAFFYVLYFQEPGVADADLGRDPADVLRRMLSARAEPPTPEDLAAHLANDGRGFVDRLPPFGGRPDWLTQEELDVYCDEFTRTGFTGGINWYRNFDRNWELTPQLADAKVTVPSLFVTGRADGVRMMTPESIMDGNLLDHRGTHVVDGAGHWVQQEAADQVNAALLAFLDELDLGGR